MVRRSALRNPGSALILLALSFSAPLFAGFSSTEVFLPAVGRLSGQGGAEFYTTVWATNLTGVAETFTFRFLKQGQANGTPASFSDTLAPGETKVYENVVQTKLGLSSTLGAARITSTGEILVAERIYDQAPGADIGDTEGLFFAGVPKSFSIALGQSASIQGINQGGAENFRYNFALVETGGGSPTVNVQLFDGSGAPLGQKAYALQPFEQLQPNVAEVFAGISTTNARITATVTAGTGSVLLAGAQLANVSQDSSGFEMSFRDDLLGGGGTAGVTSLNGLAGALTIAHGSNTTVNVNGQTITIDAVSGSGSGLTAVAHDNSLTGSGTVALPLAVANGQVVRSVNGLHDAVTLAAGSNVTVTPNGNTLTIAASGGAGDLSAVAHDTTLQGDGTSGTPLGVKLPASWATTASSAAIEAVNSGSGSGGYFIGANGVIANAEASDGIGVIGSGHAFGVEGTTDSGGTGTGVHGESGSGPGVHGESSSGSGARGDSSTGDGVLGTSGGASKAGVSGRNTAGGFGVYGQSSGDAGHFAGNVNVVGHLTKTSGTFKIDHPLDPAHKYLYHSFVESPDMMNIYNGEVTLDASGTAEVDLPDWFQALNRDFRYQLTALDTPQPGLFVSGRIQHNAFRIAGGVPGAAVSWTVTGIRQDAWANAHRVQVEETKPAAEQGTYLHPEVFGEPPSKSVERRLDDSTDRR